VSVFFVISGFLLYRPFAFAHLSGQPSLPARKFWTRRLKRIIPAYWLAFLVISYVLHADQVRHGWAALPIYLGFGQIYFPYYVLSGVTQAWSLCTEMSFYLMLPLWAGLLARRRRGVRAQLRAELLGLGTLVVIGFAYRIPVLLVHGKITDVMPNWLPGYFDLFALGMLLAVVSSWLAVEGRQPQLLWHRSVPWISWAVAAGMFISVSNIGLPLTPVTRSSLGLSLARQTLYGLFAFFLVLPAVFGQQDRGLVRRSLQLRPIVLIGVVSYGVYLWHEAAIQMMLTWTGDRIWTIPLPDLLLPVTALAVAAATLSYRLAERPILRRGRSRRVTPPGGSVDAAALTTSRTEVMGPPALADPTPDPLSKLGDIAAAAGFKAIEMVAWRDLDHPEAGGSEVHAARVAERWAAVGIDVTVSASRAPGAARSATRDGYRVERPAGRYSVFPAIGASRLARRGARPDATVEVWNGMPFFSPIWARRPRLVFLHHVHGGMWDLVLPPHLAAVGKLVERRLAPPVYRRTQVVTLSESSRQAIIDVLGLAADRVSVVPPGVDEHFCPGTRRATHPLAVAVGRLVPYKRFDRLIEVLVRVHERHPDLRAVIAGEGSEHKALEALVARHGAQDWLTLPGRVDDNELVDLYQRAWVLTSASAYEGWGLTITEAAACATPAVASPISGHVDAIRHGETGYLAEVGADMEQRINHLIENQIVRHRLQRGALRHSKLLTWDRTALDTIRLLAAETRRPGGPA
jgi:peptidoglycan/LPS O-acetylase OafA/YrhL/glycosyltransferase involved in cell wall biosynthesis